MLEIKPIQERVLKHLANYKFLTVSQLIRLNTGHKVNIIKTLKQLKDTELVKNTVYGGLIANKQGKLESIHYLSMKGVRFLETHNKHLEIQEIKFPKSINTLFKNDYFHRVSTIDAQIAFDQWAKQNGFTNLLFQTYFDKVGSQRSPATNGTIRSATRLDFLNGHFIEPDAVLMYETTQKQRNLLLLEVFNGNDTKRVVSKMKELVDALNEGIATIKYQHNLPARVLCTFEFESNLKAVIERMNQDPHFYYDAIEQYFFFQVAEKVKTNFDHWRNMKHESISLSTITYPFHP